MYSCIIKCDISQKDASNIIKLFDSEKSVDNDRATLRLNRKNGVEFIIEAKDAVAMRATANSVMKTLAVYDKIRKV